MIFALIRQFKETINVNYVLILSIYRVYGFVTIRSQKLSCKLKISVINWKQLFHNEK